jgi:hypothetical protein
MEVHYLVDHRAAKTTLQQRGAGCHVCSGWGRSAKPRHAYKPLGLWVGSLPSVKYHFVYLQRLGPSKHFPLVVGATNPPLDHFIDIFISCECGWISQLPHARQVLRKLCLFKPWQSRAPFPGQLCAKALSKYNVPLKVPYLLAHTSD